MLRNHCRGGKVTDKMPKCFACAVRTGHQSAGLLCGLVQWVRTPFGSGEGDVTAAERGRRAYAALHLSFLPKPSENSGMR